MEYRITGSIVPAVEIALQAGESMYTQSGGMSWKTEGIEMSTNTRGGLLKGIGRMFSGESLFMATYTASRPGIIAFASTVPGSVLPVSLEQTGTLIIQKGAFLCAQPSVSLEITFTKKLSSGFFGGEGFILQRLSGQGIAFAEFDGHVVEYELAPGQQIIVDTGHLAAMSASCQLEIRTVPGVKNMLFGGEGVFNTVITGPGHVWLQTMPISNVADVLRPFFPASTN